MEAGSLVSVDMGLRFGEGQDAMEVGLEPGGSKVHSAGVGRAVGEAGAGLPCPAWCGLSLSGCQPSGSRCCKQVGVRGPPLGPSARRGGARLCDRGAMKGVDMDGEQRGEEDNRKATVMFAKGCGERSHGAFPWQQVGVMMATLHPRLVSRLLIFFFKNQGQLEFFFF